jgi:hypothetical protein
MGHGSDQDVRYALACRCLAKETPAAKETAAPKETLALNDDKLKHIGHPDLIRVHWCYLRRLLIRRARSSRRSIAVNVEQGDGSNARSL